MTICDETDDSVSRERLFLLGFFDGSSFPEFTISGIASGRGEVDA
jgi:hypothetical protein